MSLNTKAILNSFVCAVFFLSCGCNLDVSLRSISEQLPGSDGAAPGFVPLPNTAASGSGETATSSTSRGASIDGYTLTATIGEPAEDQVTTGSSGGAAGYIFQTVIQ